MCQQDVLREVSETRSKWEAAYDAPVLYADSLFSEGLDSFSDAVEDYKNLSTRSSGKGGVILSADDFHRVCMLTCLSGTCLNDLPS